MSYFCQDCEFGKSVTADDTNHMKFIIESFEIIVINVSKYSTDCVLVETKIGMQRRQGPTLYLVFLVIVMVILVMFTF